MQRCMRRSLYTCPGRSPSQNEHRLHVLLAHVLFRSQITPLHATQLSAASPYSPHAAHWVQLNFHQTVRICSLVLNVLVIGPVPQPLRKVNDSRMSRRGNIYPYGCLPLTRYKGDALALGKGEFGRRIGMQLNEGLLILQNVLGNEFIHERRSRNIAAGGKRRLEGNQKQWELALASRRVYIFKVRQVIFIVGAGAPPLPD